MISNKTDFKHILILFFFLSINFYFLNSQTQFNNIDSISSYKNFEDEDLYSDYDADDDDDEDDEELEDKYYLEEDDDDNDNDYDDDDDYQENIVIVKPILFQDELANQKDLTILFDKNKDIFSTNNLSLEKVDTSLKSNLEAVFRNIDFIQNKSSQVKNNNQSFESVFTNHKDLYQKIVIPKNNKVICVYRTNELNSNLTDIFNLPKFNFETKEEVKFIADFGIKNPEIQFVAFSIQDKDLSSGNINEIFKICLDFREPVIKKIVNVEPIKNQIIENSPFINKYKEETFAGDFGIKSLEFKFDTVSIENMDLGSRNINEIFKVCLDFNKPIINRKIILDEAKKSEILQILANKEFNQVISNKTDIDYEKLSNEKLFNEPLLNNEDKFIGNFDIRDCEFKITPILIIDKDLGSRNISEIFKVSLDFNKSVRYMILDNATRNEISQILASKDIKQISNNSDVAYEKLENKELFNNPRININEDKFIGDFDIRDCEFKITPVLIIDKDLGSKNISEIFKVSLDFNKPVKYMILDNATRNEISQILASKDIKQISNNSDIAYEKLENKELFNNPNINFESKIVEAKVITALTNDDIYYDEEELEDEDSEYIEEIENSNSENNVEEAEDDLYEEESNVNIEEVFNELDINEDGIDEDGIDEDIILEIEKEESKETCPELILKDYNPGVTLKTQQYDLKTNVNDVFKPREREKFVADFGVKTDLNNYKLSLDDKYESQDINQAFDSYKQTMKISEIGNIFEPRSFSNINLSTNAKLESDTSIFDMKEVIEIKRDQSAIIGETKQVAYQNRIPFVEKFCNDKNLQFMLDIRSEVFAGKNLELLNQSLFDDYGFILNTIDLGFYVGSQRGDNLVEAFYQMRSKGVFGAEGLFVKSNEQPIKIGIGRTENEFSPSFENQLIWAREAWLSYTVEKCCYPVSIKAGLFPYKIGCGLSLGNAYKVGNNIPGMYYDIRFVDQFRPGVLFSVGDNIRYNFYYGVLNSKCANFVDTAAFIRTQETNCNKVNNPYRGSWITNYIIETDIEFCSGEKPYDVRLNPYLIYNGDSEQKVEFLGDASSQLFTIGCTAASTGLQYEINFEAAVNLGRQRVKAIDRNIFQFVSTPQQLHLFQEAKCGSETTWTAAQRRTFPEDLSASRAAGEEFSDELCGVNILYKNSYNRFRNGYENFYKGVMLCADFSACTKEDDYGRSKFGLAAAYASGGENPNDSIEKILANRFNTDTSIYSDCNKDYNGFVSIEPLYEGKAVTPIFFLEMRKLNRPLSTKESKLTYPDFTNIAFVGFGLTKEMYCDEKQGIFNANIIGYFQPFKIKKDYNYTLSKLFQFNGCPQEATDEFLADLTCDANKTLGHFLGIEANMYLQYQPCEDINFYGLAAILIPGNYYKDAEGKIIPLKEQYKLSKTDFSGIEQNTSKYNIGLGNDFVFLLNVGINVCFN